jgi:glycosyltransferase involved in cell wall biosynthesis
MSKPQRLIFQLGTNNWQSKQEFAPGSGILHEQHHNTFNARPDVVCHSVFPSRVQRFTRPDVRVFELEHDIPICESVSPVSSYRWHSMSEDEFEAYRNRLATFVTTYIDEVEATLGCSFDLFIAHHAFLNPLVMADVNRARTARGLRPVPLFAFVHGTALLMFQHEMLGDDPDYPARFYPRWVDERIFDEVRGVFVISNSQKQRFVSLFDSYDPDRVVVAPNGIDPAVFQRDETLVRDAVLGDFPTRPYEGSAATPAPIPNNCDRMVLFVGKFADIKRLDCLLKAAVIYEKTAAAAGLRVITVIAGSGPVAEQNHYQDLATELDLDGAYFIGPHEQPALARLYNVADIGVFPTKFEAFGLVFLECLACGTPVIGTAAGGPLEFVNPAVGELDTDCDNTATFSAALGDTSARALIENWKPQKAAAALEVASHYTLTAQCDRMLSGVDTLLA